MAYATAEQLEDHLGEDRYVDLTDRDRLGEPDLDAVNQSLAGASSLIDSYIARYLPIATPPQVLVEATLDVATYKLAGNRRTEDERIRYEDALAWLKDISTRKASLGLPEGAIEPAGGTVAVDAPQAQMRHHQTRRIL